MNDDLWRELAQVNRDEQSEDRSRLDERWDLLSRGELSPEEDAELRTLAETSVEARETYEAFRPLGPEFHASVVRVVREQADAETKAEAEAKAKESKKKPLPFPWRLAGWRAAAAAVAAAVLVLLLRPTVEPLPAYHPNLIGGEQDSRGEIGMPSGRRVFGPGSLLTLDAVPQSPVSGVVEARAFLDRGSGLVPLEPDPVVANGVVRLRGTVGREIRLPPGEQRIWIVVGREGEIPPLEELAAQIRAGQVPHDDWQAVSADLRIEDRPSG
jgi:hypothetical protein